MIFFLALDAAVMPFILVRVGMDSYVHCSLALERCHSQSSTVVWNQDSVYYGCSIFSATSEQFSTSIHLFLLAFYQSFPMPNTWHASWADFFHLLYVSSQLLAAVFVCVLYTFCICLNVCFKYFVFGTCL